MDSVFSNCLPVPSLAAMGMPPGRQQDDRPAAYPNRARKRTIFAVRWLNSDGV